MEDRYFAFDDSDIYDYFSDNPSVKSVITHHLVDGSSCVYGNPFYKEPIEVIMPNIELVIFNGPATIVFWG